MRKRFFHGSRHVAVWITTFALLGFAPAPAFAHHPTTDQIPGWAHFILDLRWGNVGGGFGPDVAPVTYEGSVTLSGDHGVAFPMHPYMWEWQEDRLGVFDFVPGSGQEPPLRNFSFTSVIHNHIDGLRVRVAGPKDATLTIRLNDYSYSATLEALATTHQKVIESIGNDHEIVLKTLPMPNPKAEINIFWGKIMDRNVLFNPDMNAAKPFALGPNRSGGAFAVMAGEPSGMDPFFDPETMFERFRNPEFQPFFFDEPAGVDFSGSLTVPSGTLGKVNQVSFEGDDGIVTKTDSIIAWESMIQQFGGDRAFCPTDLFGGPGPMGVLGEDPMMDPGMVPPPGFMPPPGPPPCQFFKFDRDGIRGRINLATLTDESPITLQFSSPDVTWSKTISLQSLFMHPIMEPVSVRGELGGGGFGVMMALHEPPDRKLMQAEGFAEVFFVEDGIRKHVPNPEVFEANGFDWQNIDVVPPEEFDSIPEDMFEPMPFPDGELVQPEGDPTVYLFDDGERRPIPSPDVLHGMGLDFDDVRQVPPDALQRFPEGAFVPPPGQGPPPDGVMFRPQGDPRVFVMDDGRRMPIQSQEVFEQRNFDWNRVAEIPPDHPFMGAPEGSPLPPPNGALIQPEGDPNVYVYDERFDKVRPVDDAEDFQDAGFRWQDVKPMSEGAFGQFDVGGEFAAGVGDVTHARALDPSLEIDPGPIFQPSQPPSGTNGGNTGGGY